VFKFYIKTLIYMTGDGPASGCNLINLLWRLQLARSTSFVWL